MVRIDLTRTTRYGWRRNPRNPQKTQPLSEARRVAPVDRRGGAAGAEPPGPVGEDRRLVDKVVGFFLGKLAELAVEGVLGALRAYVLVVALS